MESGIFHTTYNSDMALRRTPIMRLRIGIVIALALNRVKELRTLQVVGFSSH
jgi:hypothetical protein